ncbi:MAG: outer membrane beta-barrel protein [Gemmatimonadales bacterium]
MTRKSFGALALALGVCATTALHAQVRQPTEGTRFGLGVGATMPVGDYGDADKMGLNVLGVLQFSLAETTPVHLRVDGIYSSTAHDGVSGSTSILGGNVSALYHFSAPAATARPYILGGLGFYNVEAFGDSESKIGFGFGGGVLFGLGGFNAFAEARYLSIQTSLASTTFVPLTVGLMFGY